MQHHSQQHHSEYRPPTLAVDLVAFRVHAGVLEVLLMRRRNEPFAGEWALPGGYSIADAALFFVEYWWVKRLGNQLPPKLAAHLERMLARPAVKRALEAEGLSA